MIFQASVKPAVEILSNSCQELDLVVPQNALGRLKTGKAQNYRKRIEEVYPYLFNTRGVELIKGRRSSADKS